MADEQLPVELDPRFQALKPEEQATVRAAWAQKFAALQPAERTTVMDAWRKKYPPKADTGTALQLDERGQPLAPTTALPPGTVEDVEATLPGKKKTFMEHMEEPNRPLMAAAKKIENPVLGGAAEFGAEQITPANLVLMGGLSKLPETAGRAALGAFSAMALKAMAREAPEAYQLWQAGDKMGALRTLTKLGLTGIVAALGGKATAEGLAADVAGAHAPQVHGPTAETYESAPLGVTAEEMQTPPASAPPPPAAAPAEPPAPVRGLEDLDLSKIGRQPPPGAMDINIPPEATREQVRAQKGLEGLELEGEAPIAYEEGEPPRGPKPAQEPYETVPSDLMNVAPEPREGLETEALIGEPEGAIEPPPGAEGALRGVGELTRETIPADLTGQPEPGIEAELARQEATLDGQTKAAKAIRKAMPRSPAAEAIEAQAVETAAKIQDLRRAVEHQKAEAEPPTVQNPPAAPANEARLRSELLMRNVNPDNPQAVMEHVKDTLGLKKPAQATTVGVYPVSKSTETPTRYEADFSAPFRASKAVHEGGHMEEAEGGPKPPEGPGANDVLVNRYLSKNNMSDRTLMVNKALQDAADAFEGPTREQMGIAASVADQIKAGAMGRETRTEFREAGPKPETKMVGVSEAEVLDLKGRVGDALNDAVKLSREILQQGDATSRLAAKAAYDQASRLVKEWTVASRAASRSLSAFQMPAEAMRRMRELGLTLKELREVKLREPLLNEIAETARSWQKGDLSRAEAAPVIYRDVVDAFRYNLFSPFSFMLHVMFSDVPFQVARSAGMDAARAVMGDASAPNLRGWVYSLADRVPGLWGKAAELDPRIQQALGEKTASGEITRGGFGGPRGTFLRREGPVSTTADYLMGTPLYAKVALDRAAGNLSAEATLWAEALKRTPKELEGEAARNWRRDFVDRSAPDDVMEQAVENAKKAKFNRPLSKFEERVAGSTTYRLLVDVFARWPFQATRAMGEWFGYDPKVFAKIKAGTLSSEELGGYMAKTATGLGGLTLLNQLVYPNVDFNSMEYVHRDDHGMETGRTRLVEPVPAALVLLGMGRAVANFGMGNKDEAQRDLEAAHHALQYSSIPFAKLAGAMTGAGELGGVLSSALGWLGHGGQDRQRAMDPNGLRRAFIDQVNRLMPGQAVLAALKQIMDPVEREGLGARLPGISEALQQRPNRTQGGPMIRTRELPLGAGEASLSANMPGSTRKMDPVEALLMRYGEPVYRGPRTPVAGVPAAEIPDDLKAEWEEELGLARQQLLGPLAHRLALQGNDLESLGPERARALVRSMDSKAAALATKRVAARHDPQPKPFRRESLQEMIGPEERHLQFLKARADREAAQKAAQ